MSEAWTLEFNTCAIWEPQWDENTQQMLQIWLKPIIASAAVILLLKQIADFRIQGFYEHGRNLDEAPPGGDKTEVLRCHDLISQPEGCSLVQWHIRPVWMEAEEGFPSLPRSGVWLPSCLAEKWHHMCWEPVLCAAWVVVPAAAGLCDRSPPVLAALPGRWWSLPGQFEGLVALHVRIVQGRNHLAWRRVSEAVWL